MRWLKHNVRVQVVRAVARVLKNSENSSFHVRVEELWKNTKKRTKSNIWSVQILNVLYKRKRSPNTLKRYRSRQRITRIKSDWKEQETHNLNLINPLSKNNATFISCINIAECIDRSLLLIVCFHWNTLGTYRRSKGKNIESTVGRGKTSKSIFSFISARLRFQWFRSEIFQI